jgi:hypothetical protein
MEFRRKVELGATARDPNAQVKVKGVVSELPVEHCWKIWESPILWTATHVQEIPPERADSLADTMAPIEELTSVLGCPVPWTVCALTRRGLERKMRRIEKKQGFVGERRYLR